MTSQSSLFNWHPAGPICIMVNLKYVHRISQIKNDLCHRFKISGVCRLKSCFVVMVNDHVTAALLRDFSDF